MNKGNWWLMWDNEEGILDNSFSSIKVLSVDEKENYLKNELPLTINNTAFEESET